jgi:hypothetical protein
MACFPLALALALVRTAIADPTPNKESYEEKQVRWEMPRLEKLEALLADPPRDANLSFECWDRTRMFEVLSAHEPVRDRVARAKAACAKIEEAANRGATQDCEKRAAPEARRLPVAEVHEAVYIAAQPSCPDGMLEQTAKIAVERKVPVCEIADAVAKSKDLASSPTASRAIEECTKQLLAMLARAENLTFASSFLRAVLVELGAGARLRPALAPPVPLAPRPEPPRRLMTLELQLTKGKECIVDDFSRDVREPFAVSLTCGIEERDAGERVVDEWKVDLIRREVNREAGERVSRSLAGPGYLHLRKAKAKLRQYRRVTFVRSASTDALIAILATPWTEPTTAAAEHLASIGPKPTALEVTQEVSRQQADAEASEWTTHRGAAESRFRATSRSSDAATKLDAAIEHLLYASDPKPVLDAIAKLSGMRRLTSVVVRQ